MRQLLIVNSGKALNATGATPKDLSKLDAGAILFHELESDVTLSAAPTKNFAIALGRKNGQLPFIIPEVDIETLSVVKSTAITGVNFKVVFTLTPAVGKEYTLRFFKKGTVPHERNSWTVNYVAKTTTGATEAAEFVRLVNAKASDKFRFTATNSGATITITSNDYEMWEVKGVDELANVSITQTDAVKPTNDKAYVQNLASFCAAGKGFTDTLANGATTIPGYPEEVEDTTYNVYTLRFKVGRDASKTRDERVWQNVYIAVPSTSAIISTLEQILGFSTTGGGE